MPVRSIERSLLVYAWDREKGNFNSSVCQVEEIDK